MGIIKVKDIIEIINEVEYDISSLVNENFLSIE